MISCQQVRERGPELVLGTLDGVERAQVLAHLDECPGCREDVSRLTETVDAIGQLAPSLEPSPGFHDRVLAAMSPTAVVALHTKRRPRLGSVLVAAAAAILALVLSFGVVHDTDAGSSGVKSAAMVGEGGQTVGDAYLLDASPRFVVVSLSYAFPGSAYDLQGVGDEGQVVTLGHMKERDGQWRWSGPLRGDIDVHALRVVTPGGRVACQGDFN